jgi:GNAT superfamily N-acetyltransferase
MTDRPHRIRSAAAGDAGALASLSAELGYPATADEVASRLVDAAGRDERAVFVAENDGEVVGWLDVLERRLIQQPAIAEIQGLVVAGEWRGAGVGAALMARAEAWARDRGLEVVTVRSRTSRSGANAFYRSLGYEDLKASLVFVRHL